jgi:nucleoid-associated protein YgaU
MALEHAVICNTVTTEEITVMFDPEEYTIHRENTFAELSAPGSQSPILQFAAGKLRTLDMELLLDTLEEHKAPGGTPVNRAGDDVSKLVARLTDLMSIDRATHAPPVLLFCWASLQFQCVMARCSERVVMTKDDGTPLRARLQVTFSEFVNPALEARSIKRETADYSKLRTVRAGETLPGLAYELYGDPRLWRPLASANGLFDPRNLEIGQKLVVPRLPYRDPETGEEWGT